MTRVGLGDGVNGERSDRGDRELVLLGESSHDGGSERGGAEGEAGEGETCDGVSSNTFRHLQGQGYVQLEKERSAYAQEIG